MKGLERILELQEIDLAIDRHTSRRTELESGRAIAEARARLETLENQIGEIRLALDSVVREQTRLESEVQSLEMKIGAEEKRLYDGSVANPKELESIQSEIAGLKGRKKRVEDDVLGQMERREELEVRLPPLESDREEATRRFAELESTSAEELVDIAKALEERAAERERLLPEYDEDLLDLYESLRSSKKGVAAAALVDGVCQGCHQKLSPLELSRMKKVEGIWRCDYCRRILIPT